MMCTYMRSVFNGKLKKPSAQPRVYRTFLCQNLEIWLPAPLEPGLLEELLPLLRGRLLLVPARAPRPRYAASYSVPKYTTPESPGSNPPVITDWEGPQLHGTSGCFWLGSRSYSVIIGGQTPSMEFSAF